MLRRVSACAAAALLATLAPGAGAVDDSSRLVQAKMIVREGPRKELAGAEAKDLALRFSWAMKSAQHMWMDFMERTVEEEPQFYPFVPTSLEQATEGEVPPTALLLDSEESKVSESEVATQASEEPETAESEVSPTAAPLAAEAPAAPESAPTPELLTEEERQAQAREAKRVRYGELLTLAVRPLVGPELAVAFRDRTRLQVLMHSVASKLGLTLAHVTFTHQGRPLEPKSTPLELGIADRDVIEVSTPALVAERHALDAKAERETYLALRRNEREEAEDIRNRIKEEKRRVVRAKVAKKLAEQKRRHDIMMRGETTLRFVNPDGGADVVMAVKKDNWLKAYLDLVAKRMNLDRSKTRFLFRDDDDLLSEIEPHDSVKSLGLLDDERVVLKVSHKQ